jgi:cytochrome c-type biogenesis protein CcmH
MVDGLIFKSLAMLRRVVARVLVAGLLAATGLVALTASLAYAADAVPAAEDPVLEAKVLAIAVELRCLVCQNQTIADSHADLANDLRRQVRDMLQQGKSKPEILDFMTARYGDFVLYRPPVKNTTALLWYGPALLFGGAALTLLLVMRRRARVGAERFEADPESDLGDAGIDPRPSPSAQHKTL